MIKKIFKKVLPILLSFMLVASVTPIHTFAAGTTLSALDGAITITDTNGTISLSGTTATLKSTSGRTGSKTNTITIVNESESRAKLSFDATVLIPNTDSSISIDGKAISANQSGMSYILEAGASIQIVLVAKSEWLQAKTTTLTLSNLALQAVSGAFNVTVNYDSALGSVTLNGAAVESGYTQSLENLEVSATAKSGVTFLGWVNEDTNMLVSEGTAYSTPLAENTVLSAVFVNDNSPAYFKVTSTSNSYLYTDLTVAGAMAATVSKKVVVLANNGTLAAGNYTIPAGVTLLIPFDTANTLYTAEPEGVGSPSFLSAKPNPWEQPYVFRKLTMASGANITVNGAISLSAKHANPSGAMIRGAGSPSGPCSYIYMNENSNITVNSGANLYAWGYIYGKGSVLAKSGANIYENFQFEDFRGGDQTTGIKNGVFPLSQYYIQNIEVPLTIEAGATESCYTSIYMNRMKVSSDLTFFAKSGAMFNLTTGTVTKRYDGATDRLVIELDGDMTVSPITMDFGLDSMDSSEYVLPINSNITVSVNKGNILMNQDLAILPGAKIEVGENAAASLDEGISVYAYDSDEWGNYCAPSNQKFFPLQYAPGRTYTRTAADLKDAEIIINGTMDASKGFVYTTKGGANVYSTGAGKLITKPGTKTVTYQVIQAGDPENSEYPEIPITPAKLKNKDCKYIQTGDNTYTYTDGYWRCATHTEEATIIPPTCTEDGYTTHTCTVCGYSYNDTPVPAAHKYKETVNSPTCTDPGNTVHTCTECGETYIDGEVSALGHKYTEEVIAPTCSAEGYTIYTCSVCGDKYSDNTTEKLPHSYTSVVTPPTCTTNGYTVYTCTVCGDTYSGDNVEALPHSFEDTVIAPTCTTDGYTIHTCSVCGLVEKDNYIEASHSYSEEWTIDKEATHKEAGSMAHYCTVCGEKTDVTEIPMLTVDISGDGIIDEYDLSKVKQEMLYSGTLSDEERIKADANDDGIIDLKDYIIILRKTK